MFLLTIWLGEPITTYAWSNLKYYGICLLASRASLTYTHKYLSSLMQGNRMEHKNWLSDGLAYSYLIIHDLREQYFPELSLKKASIVFQA